AISPIKALSEGSWRLLLTSGLTEYRFFTESLFYLNYYSKKKNLLKVMIPLKQSPPILNIMFMSLLLAKVFAVTSCTVMAFQ
ncbi:hypothetical protein, partial [Providencia alcalifaciens]|uniref:hypothetical protein n=1 Tax=Providencia alcalifaciens TaxID=126385 RepID=UPI002B052B2D